MKVKEESEKLASNSTFRKRRWWHPVLANRWGNNGNSENFFLGAPKSLQMATAAMKLKDTCSLEERL